MDIHLFIITHCACAHMDQGVGIRTPTTGRTLPPSWLSCVLWSSRWWKRCLRTPSTPCRTTGDWRSRACLTSCVLRKRCVRTLARYVLCRKQLAGLLKFLLCNTCVCLCTGAAVSWRGAEACRSGAEVSRGVSPSARAAAGPVGAGCVREGALAPHPPPKPKPGETQRQETQRNLQEAQAQMQEWGEDQHAARYIPLATYQGWNHIHARTHVSINGMFWGMLILLRDNCYIELMWNRKWYAITKPFWEKKGCFLSSWLAVPLYIRLMQFQILNENWKKSPTQELLQHAD